METTYGPVCVAVCGDPDKPALITYPDVALNCKRTYILTSSSLATYPKLLNWGLFCDIFYVCL